MNENETFYMVFVKDGSSPRYRHADFESADTEAKRLAKLTGVHTYVLQAIKKIKLVEFVEIDLGLPL